MLGPSRMAARRIEREIIIGKGNALGEKIVAQIESTDLAVDSRRKWWSRVI